MATLTEALHHPKLLRLRCRPSRPDLLYARSSPSRAPPPRSSGAPSLPSSGARAPSPRCRQPEQPVISVVAEPRRSAGSRSSRPPSAVNDTSRNRAPRPDSGGEEPLPKPFFSPSPFSAVGRQPWLPLHGDEAAPPWSPAISYRLCFVRAARLCSAPAAALLCSLPSPPDPASPCPPGLVPGSRSPRRLTGVHQRR